jgi:hypothetical protein
MSGLQAHMLCSALAVADHNMNPDLGRYHQQNLHNFEAGVKISLVAIVQSVGVTHGLWH